jgi:class 3 adenylate cyclase
MPATGWMVVFNDPVPVENSALRAVLMALEMRDAIGTLTARPPPTDTTSFEQFFTLVRE